MKLLDTSSLRKSVTFSIIAMFTEIEEIKEKDKIILAKSRQAAMGDMISMIVHQWRQPITAIGIAAQNINGGACFTVSLSINCNY